jgi:hypothetical protein
VFRIHAPLIAAIGALIPLAAAGQQRFAPAPFDLTRRALDIRVDYAAGSLAGTETLHLRNVAKKPAREVPLLLNRLMTVARVTDASGAPFVFRQSVALFEDDSLLQVDAITVTLRRAVQPGDSIALVVHYGGHLVGYAETGSLYIRDVVDSAFTIIREDAYAYPALGVPSRKANRQHGYPPFDFAARVTVPAGMVVATGGEQLATTRHDSVVSWSYRSVAPATFLNIAIAPYRTLDGAGFRIFYLPEDSAGAQLLERAVAGAVAQFAAWYGPLGGDARLTVIEIPDGWGSQASLAGGIIQTAAAFRDRAQFYQVYHELSHLWNVEDVDRPSPRWNEGLAMFLQWRMAGQLDGWAGWDAALDRAEKHLRRDCQPPAPCGTVPFAEYGKAELTDLSYSVGMAMFYALYKTLGADAFDKAYREFYQQHRAAGATSAQLIAAFNAASPASDAIFTEWFTTTKWYSRLSAAESLRQIVNGYAR